MKDQYNLIYKLPFIILLLISSNNFGQSISGVIKDAKSKKPIAFVNLKIPNSSIGTSTDIDGKFTLRTPSNYTGNLLISHVSYQKLAIKSDNPSIINDQILLLPKITNLDELVFLAKENPAHNIIRKAVANRKQHDPNRLSSYQYKSYSKEIIRLDGDSQMTDSIIWKLSETDTLSLSKKDSTVLRIDSLVKRQHFFINESITEKKYLSPGLVIERLLAINTTGFKSPLFATTGTDYQPFGFYDEVITIFDKPHINPISVGTLNRYEFYIEDTAYYQQDTVFVMSFIPKKAKKFESLRGQISISKNGYAIRNVIAYSTDPLAKLSLKIQQFYQCFDGTWFPTQLNTDVVFNELDFYGRNMMMEAKSYFSDIVLNEELSKKEFSDVVLELSEIDETISTNILVANRHEVLDSLELKTYVIWDTLDNKLSKMTNLMEYLVTERVPLWGFDFSLSKFAQFNQYEKIRIGVGGFTNQKLSQSIQLGAYIGYGFGDGAWKYGSSIKLNLSQRTSTHLKFAYAKDLIELGRGRYIGNAKVLNQQLLRSIEGSKFDSFERYIISMDSRIAPFTYGQVSLEKSNVATTYTYNYLMDDGSSFDTFNFTELSIALRYVKNEKYINLKGNKVLFGHGFPIITVNYTQGISDLLEGDYDYHQIDFSIDFEKRSRFGHTKIFLRGGIVNGNVPINKLITGQGNNTSSFMVPHFFQTMGLYEFVSDKDLSLFVSHNLGNILLNKKYTKPELILYQNTALGDISNPQRHQNITFDTLEEGYLESGIGLKNLIRMNYVNIGYVGFGADVFYRYGTYQFTKTSDNFAVRFNFDFTF